MPLNVFSMKSKRLPQPSVNRRVMTEEHRPVLIVVAGPNGSGKTTITSFVCFFVATSHPSINAARIAKRVIQGGHDVPISKIISRYQKSIFNCKKIIPSVDRLYVYDNSVEDQDASLLFRMSDGKLVKNIPTIFLSGLRQLCIFDAMRGAE